MTGPEARASAGRTPASQGKQGGDTVKVAVTAQEPGMQARVDPRLGRAPCFVIVETEDMSHEVLANPYASQKACAGLSAAGLLVEKGVKAVLTGVCGPYSHQVLTGAGVEVVTGISGTVREAVEWFAGRLGGEAGTGAAGGPVGRGRGYGRGGPGRPGRGPGPAPAFAGTELTPEQEAQMLELQAQQLEEALRNIRRRLDELRRGGGA